jgi:uncharacterized protein with NRDE domain
MCFALLAIQSHPHYPFILAANRDEYFARKSACLDFWFTHPQIVGGQDLVSGGSWLAINSTNQRLALVTNYRAGLPQAQRLSRGLLVKQVLTSQQPLDDTMQELEASCQAYGLFNLIAGQLPNKLYYLANHNEHTLHPLTPGIYALSNAALDTPWPKVRYGKQAFIDCLTKPTLKVECLFKLLQNTQSAPDNELPDTGIGLIKERWLSSVFIQGQDYGTRCSTIILQNQQGQVDYYERSFTPNTPPSTLHLTLNR